MWRRSFRASTPSGSGSGPRQVAHATGTQGGLPLWGAIASTNVETGASQRYRYGTHTIVEEHVCVPDARGPGWVLGTALDYARKQTLLSCFAVDALADDPGEDFSKSRVASRACSCSR